MLERLTNRTRRWAAFALAGGVVLVDSASRILSMCSDLVIVGLLLAVLMLGKPSRD